jgi:hypothetical protein
MEKQQEYAPEKLAECLISFIKLLSSDKKIHRFILEIAEQAIHKSKAGKDTFITTKELFLELCPGQNEANASSTLANIWKNISKLQDEVSVRLTEHAVNEFGLDVYPWIEKIDSDGGAGNLVKYRLIGIKVNKAEVVGPNPYRDKIAHDIEYTAVQDFKPSRIAKLFFDEGYEISGYKKWIMIFIPFLQMIIYLLMIVALLYLLKKQTLATLSFYHLVLLAASVWFLLNKVKKFERFTEDRIIIASDYLMSWSETSLVQELVTVNDEKGNFLYKKVQLTKYVGLCSICNSQVELAKGEPDFPRRIIGRCKESPREHVYSFDRVTKLGSFLGKMGSKCL